MDNNKIQEEKKSTINSIKRSQIKAYFFIIVQIITITIIASQSNKVRLWLKANQDTTSTVYNINESVDINESINNLSNSITSDPLLNSYVNNSNNIYEIDWEKLKASYPDLVGYVKLNGTNISYPIVQANNNDFYLDHSADKSYNQAGWVFMDYRNNNTVKKNDNTILYGHARLIDGTMFGSLINILEEKWQNDPNNKFVTYQTEDTTYIYQVFSVYQIEKEVYYIYTDFNNNSEKNKWLNTIKNRSVYDYNLSLNENDKILTFSTCAGIDSSSRIVLHAKLVYEIPQKKNL